MSDSIERFDAIVVGAGQAGPALAVRCAQQGLKTAIVERGPLGGTCVNNGCVPTKTWVASARAAQVARRAAEWGVRLDAPVRVDMAAVKARKDTIVEQSRAGLERWLGGSAGLTVLRGHARFVAPQRLDVDGRLLEAPRIFLNVGGAPARPPMPGLDTLDGLALDHRGLLELDTLPEYLVVIGGSYIGLEFAQMFRRFGARVTVCEMGPRLIAREDDDVSQAVRDILDREGVDVRVDAKCLSVSRVAHPDGDRVRVHTSCTSGEPDVEGSHLLLAVGRTPNTAGLGLDTAGIATDARGYIVVNERLETSAPGVWALGDCNGRGAFTHTAWNDQEIVAANLFDGEDRTLSERVPVYALFIDPPLGRAGLTEREVRERGLDARVARLPMARVGRAREAGETQGFMKVLVDANTQRILGAALLGLGADEVVHSLVQVMAAGLPYTAITRTMPIHPTVSELLPTLLGELRPLS